MYDLLPDQHKKINKYIAVVAPHNPSAVSAIPYIAINNILLTFSHPF